MFVTLSAINTVVKQIEYISRYKLFLFVTYNCFCSKILSWHLMEGVLLDYGNMILDTVQLN